MPAKRLRNAFDQYLVAPPDGAELANARRLPRTLIAANPWQPRRHADPERLRELAADIAARGILEPLLVRPVPGGRYEVIAGERRYQAAGLAGLEELPCLILDDLSEDEARAIALVENLQREDLDVEDEARFLAELHAGGLSLRDIAARIHKSHQYVQRRLRLVADPAALEAYRAGQLNLEDLVSERAAPPADVPMAELARAATDAAAAVLQGGDDLLQDRDFVTQRYRPPTPVVFDEEAVKRNLHYKPYHRLVLQARRDAATTARAIPPDERPHFRRTVGDLIDALTELVRALDGHEEEA